MHALRGGMPDESTEIIAKQNFQSNSCGKPRLMMQELWRPFHKIRGFWKDRLGFLQRTSQFQIYIKAMPRRCQDNEVHPSLSILHRLL